MKLTIEQKILAKDVSVAESIIDIVKDRVSSAKEANPAAAAELLDMVAKIKTLPAKSAA